MTGIARTLFIAPVGRQIGAVAAPVKTMIADGDHCILIHTGEAGTQQEAQRIKKYLENLNHGASFEAVESSSWADRVEPDGFAACIILANGGEIDTVFAILDHVRSAFSNSTQARILLAVSRDTGLKVYNLDGTELRSIPVGNISSDPNNPEELMTLLGVKQVSRAPAGQNPAITVGLRRHDKVWIPGVPLTMTEQSGFLVCRLNLKEKLMSGNGRDRSLKIRVLGDNRQWAETIASAWYRDFLESARQFSELSLDRFNIHLDNIDRTITDEYPSFIDRLVRHGIHFTYDPGTIAIRGLTVNVPPEMHLAARERNSLLRDDALEARDRMEQIPSDVNADRSVERNRRLAVIVGTNPTTTIVTIWNFKPDELHLYYDPGESLSVIHADAIGSEAKRAFDCAVAYHPLSIDTLAIPYGAFTWAAKPGDKVSKILFRLGCLDKTSVTINTEIADSADVPLKSWIRMHSPINASFDSVWGPDPAIAYDPDIRAGIGEVIRNNTAIQHILPELENRMHLINQFDEYWQIFQSDLDAETDDNKRNGFIWERLVSSMLHPVVDELLSNVKIRCIGAIHNNTVMDSEEFDITVKAANRFGLLSCKSKGTGIRMEELFHFCREAEFNAERYLGNRSHGVVVSPALDEEKLKKWGFTPLMRDGNAVNGAWIHEAGGLRCISANSFDWTAESVIHVLK